ncbi:MAG TPA: Atu2307/SP_0267 family LLM class monooxygenase [Fimbriimonadaceae bacterium]|jgi:probable LLM family oxidoreductase
MQLGIDTFVATPFDPALRTPETDVQRVDGLLQEAELADRIGLDVFAVGEHHRREFVSSAPTILLAAIAAKTNNITLASAVTVLSSDDPIRVFQQFATIDLISHGRAEIIVGRGSFIESYPLFGYDLSQYDLLFKEKLDLLLMVRDETEVHWRGSHRAELTGQGVYPRPIQNPLPIRLGVGGSPESFVRAGKLGLPLTLAIIGGEAVRFRRSVDSYREAWIQAGHDPANIDVAVHTIGFLDDTDQKAADNFYPSYSDTFTRIGKERGWPPTTREQYDATISPRGALMVGSPESVAAKIRHFDKALGGISRLSILLDGGLVPHEHRLHAIELLGTKVKPMLEESVTG